MDMVVRGLPFVDVDHDTPTAIFDADDELDLAVAPDFGSAMAEWIQDNGPNWACVALNLFGPEKAAVLLLGKKQESARAK